MERVFFNKAIRLNESRCPRCNARLDAVTPAVLDEPDSSGPTKNSFTICLYCSTILRFSADLRLHQATPDDLVELMNNDPRIFSLLQSLTEAAQERIRQARRDNYQSN